MKVKTFEKIFYGSLIWGLLMFAASVISNITGRGKEIIDSVGEIYVGYDNSIKGAVYGFVYGFFDGIVSLSVLFLIFSRLFSKKH